MDRYSDVLDLKEFLVLLLTLNYEVNSASEPQLLFCNFTLQPTFFFLVETSRIYTFCSAFATSCMNEISRNPDQKTLPHLFQKFTSANVTSSPEGNTSYKTSCSLPFCLACFRLHS